jgi:hypothetical protein
MKPIFIQEVFAMWKKDFYQDDNLPSEQVGVFSSFL